MIRLLLTLLATALMIGFMWGLRTFMYSMSQDFAAGVLFATFLLVGLMWLHVKFVGPIN